MINGSSVAQASDRRERLIVVEDDPVTRELMISDGTPVPLTRAEFDLLAAIVDAAKQHCMLRRVRDDPHVYQLRQQRPPKGPRWKPGGQGRPLQ